MVDKYPLLLLLDDLRYEDPVDTLDDMLDDIIKEVEEKSLVVEDDFFITLVFWLVGVCGGFAAKGEVTVFGLLDKGCWYI